MLELMGSMYQLQKNLGGSKEDYSNTNLIHLVTQETVFTPLETGIYFESI
jgi:hypothetical protein